MRPPIRVGVTPGIDIWTRPWEERRDVVALVADAGIDHVFFADHVSFRVGHGHDGMVVAAAVANLHPTIGIYIGVYLLPLRHPLPVARQLANLGEMAPGRISFGVGVGGDDRHEVEVCGVDPKTRGKRTDESLEIVQRLLSGETFDYSGEFFQFEQARIIPVPDPAIPVYVGGRADAALRRAGRYADGWLGIWCSSERYAESIELFDRAAEERDRSIEADHGIQLWVAWERIKMKRHPMSVLQWKASTAFPLINLLGTHHMAPSTTSSTFWPLTLRQGADTLI